jgi:hypothetical protein
MPNLKISQPWLQDPPPRSCAVTQRTRASAIAVTPYQNAPAAETVQRRIPLCEVCGRADRARAREGAMGCAV